MQFEQKAAKAATTAGPTGADSTAHVQDIFRKKLMHVKAASEKEIAQLRGRVAELEEQKSAAATARRAAPYARKKPPKAP